MQGLQYGLKQQETLRETPQDPGAQEERETNQLTKNSRANRSGVEAGRKTRTQGSVEGVTRQYQATRERHLQETRPEVP